GLTSNYSLVPRRAPYRPALERMTADLAAALAPSGGAVYVAHELVNHTGDSGGERVADDYGSVVDGNPKLNPARARLAAPDAPVLSAACDGGARALSGPVALAALPGGALAVAHEASRAVAVVSSGGAPADRVRAVFSVGAGPAGVAYDARRDAL